jgi:hypothetical protein
MKMRMMMAYEYVLIMLCVGEISLVPGGTFLHAAFTQQPESCRFGDKYGDNSIFMNTPTDFPLSAVMSIRPTHPSGTIDTKRE